MFDDLIIDKIKYKVFFDKKNMKFYVESSFDKNPKEYLENNCFIKIHNYMLHISNNYRYNVGNCVYDVLYYIGFQYNDFGIDDLRQIRFESKKISELFYNKNQKNMKLSYKFNKGNSRFKLNIISSNKLENTKYGELNSKSCMTIDLIRCDGYDSLDRIIKGSLNLLSILSVDIEIKNCSIYVKNDENNVGEIVFKKFKQKEKYIDLNFSMGNLWYLEHYITDIFDTIYETPNMNLYFLSCHQLEYDNYDFFNIYSCYEYEYSKMNKKAVDERDEVAKINDEKSKALSMLDLSAFSERFINYIKNYNPLVGHRQKLENGLTSIKSLMYREYSDLEFRKFISDIYNLRIKITHNPSGNFIIDDTLMVSNFSQAVYILLLKRCGIDNETIKKTVKDFFVIVL